MGSVYLASQTEPVKRQVALKLIKTGMDSQGGAGPVRRRAAGPGPDGPPEHRPHLRRRRHPGRPAVLRHGAGQGRAAHRLLRRAAAAGAGPAGAVRGGLPGGAARPPEGDHPPRPQAGQRAGHGGGRPADAEGDRLRRGQGDRAEADRHELRGHRGDRRHAGVHVARSRPTRRRWTSTRAPTCTPSA